MVERRRGGDEHEREETAGLIVQAARRLFMAHGYRAVSTRQVAEAVGLTQPALYHHFATKEDLYVAVALAEVARLRAGLEHVARREGSARERLHGCARFLLTAVDYDFQMMFHDMRAELSERSRETLGGAFFGGLLAPLARIIAGGQATGELRDEATGGLSATGGAGLFMAFVAHFLDRPLLGETSSRAGGVDASAALLVDLLIGGLGAHPDGTN
jgi:AcrR family transcriptional regulator